MRQSHLIRLDVRPSLFPSALMRCALLALILILLLPRAGQTQQPHARSDTTIRVRVVGVVRDAHTGEAVPGAIVRELRGTATAESDSSGKFGFLVPHGATLHVTRVGYVPTTALAATGMDILLGPAAQRLEGVTVVALRGDASAPHTQSRRTGEMLARNQAGQDVPFMLTRMPSVTVASDAGNGMGYTSFRVRGLDQTRVNVTLDGVPLNEPEDHGIYFSNYPDFLNSVGSVQLQRGVGTSSYGTAAYAGALNFESLPLGRMDRSTELLLGGGSFGTVRTALEGQSGMLPSGLSAHGRVSLQKTDGYRRNGWNRSGSMFGSAGYFAGRHVWKLTAFTGLAQNGMAYLASPVESLRGDPRHNPLGSDERDQFAQHFASVTHTAGLTNHATLQTTLYHVQLRGDYDVRAESDLLNFNLGSRWTGILSTARWTAERWTIETGAHASTYRRAHWLAIRPDRATHLYDNAGRKREASAFAKGRYVIGRFALTGDLQGRHARFVYEPDGAAGIPPLAVEWRFVNPKVGISLETGVLGQVYASLGRTSREPTRNDMFAGFDNLDTSNVAFVGSLDRVRPERVTDTEAGVRRLWGIAEFQLNAFHMAFRDEIAPVGELSYIGLPLRRNVARSVRQGVELDVVLRPGGRIEGSITGARQRSRIASYTDDATGTTYRDVEPLLTPRMTAAHDLRLRLTPAVAVLVGGRYTGASFLTNTGDARFRLPAAYLSDLGVSWSVGRYAAEVTVLNALDARAYSGGYTDGTAASYFPLASRHAMLTLRAKL